MSSLPDLWYGIGWNVDPNDTSAVPSWTDHSSMVTRVDEIARGRQYELGQSMAAQPTIRFRDPSEHLNPANTASPYAPWLLPYRHLANLAVWPVLGTGNLLNSGTWRVPYDGSFESYAVGAIPGWLAGLETTPVVTTANPQQGTQSLTYAVASSTTRQGITYAVPCVPGRQYASSAYVRQTSASTQQIWVTDQILVNDQFEQRTVANGWGTPRSAEPGQPAAARPPTTR